MRDQNAGRDIISAFLKACRYMRCDIRKDLSDNVRAYKVIAASGLLPDPLLRHDIPDHVSEISRVDPIFREILLDRFEYIDVKIRSEDLRRAAL